jgi:hypothetical protein
VDSIPVLAPVPGEHEVACHFADRSPAERDRLTAEAREDTIVAPVPEEVPAPAPEP